MSADLASPAVASVLRELWNAPGERVYAVLDAARDGRVLRAVETGDERFACLYAGALPRALAEVAPYLVELERGSRLAERLVAEGWGDAWGVFATSPAGFEDVRRHLRRFLRVRTEDGRRMVFRYYDPRVLRAYLPTCTAEELAGFLGPLTAYAMEGDDAASLLMFGRSNGAFALRRVALGG